MLSTDITHLDGDIDLVEAALTGDFTGCELTRPDFRGCRFDHAQLTGSVLEHARFVDCLFVDCDLSGVRLENCSMTRVELRSCRASGLQASNGRFSDVGIFDSKLDGANFRMSVWERAELSGCDLAESDFYAAKVPDSRIVHCDLHDVELSNCQLSGTVLNGSVLDGLRGGGSLRDVTIGSEQIVPAAMAIFAAMDVRVRDEA